MLVKATAPHPVNIAGGRILAIGETADIDPTDPHNAALLDDGQLTPLQGVTAVEGKPPQRQGVIPRQKTPPQEETA